MSEIVGFLTQHQHLIGKVSAFGVALLLACVLVSEARRVSRERP